MVRIWSAPTFAKFAHGVHMVCAWFAKFAPGSRSSHMVCIWSAHGLHMICAWFAKFAHGLHMVRTRFAHGSLSVYTIYQITRVSIAFPQQSSQCPKRCLSFSGHTSAVCYWSYQLDCCVVVRLRAATFIECGDVNNWWLSTVLRGSRYLHVRVGITSQLIFKTLTY